MRLKVTGPRTTTPACPGVPRTKASHTSARTTRTPAAASTRQMVRTGTRSRAPRSSGSVGPNSSRTTDTLVRGAARASSGAGQADDLQPALQRLKREGARLAHRGPAEERGIVAHVCGDPLGAQHALGHRAGLDQGALDGGLVARVLVGHVAQEARAEGDVAMLVAGHVGEARNEAGQRAGPLVEVDDEVLAGERQHPLGDHVVDRDRLDERLAVLRLDGQAVHPAVEHLVEERVELRVEVLARLLQALLQTLGFEYADLAVEAVEEGDVARLVGDLGAQEDAHVLVGDGAHDRPELRRHALLADEERAQAVQARHALLRIDALVPVDAVLGEVEVLHRPLLALPELVELAVGQEVRLAAVGRLLQGGIARRAEVHAVGAQRGVLGHGREPSARLAGRPTWNRSATLGPWTSPSCAAIACSCARSSRTTSTASSPSSPSPPSRAGGGRRPSSPTARSSSGPSPASPSSSTARWPAGWGARRTPTPCTARSGWTSSSPPPVRGRDSGARRCGWSSPTTPSAGTTASPSTRRPTTSGPSGPTRPSASSPSVACATTSSAPTAAGTTAC